MIAIIAIVTGFCLLLMYGTWKLLDKLFPIMPDPFDEDAHFEWKDPER